MDVAAADVPAGTGPERRKPWSSLHRNHSHGSDATRRVRRSACDSRLDVILAPHADLHLPLPEVRRRVRALPVDVRRAGEALPEVQGQGRSACSTPSGSFSRAPASTRTTTGRPRRSRPRASRSRRSRRGPSRSAKPSPRRKSETKSSDQEVGLEVGGIQEGLGWLKPRSASSAARGSTRSSTASIEHTIHTPYGPPSAPVSPRHPLRTSRRLHPPSRPPPRDPPHAINYRANLWAFKELGVDARAVARRRPGRCSRTSIRATSSSATSSSIARPASADVLRRPAVGARVVRRPLLRGAAADRRRGGALGRDERGRRRDRRRDRRAALRDARRIGVVPATGVGGHQHDPVPRVATSPASSRCAT